MFWFRPCFGLAIKSIWKFLLWLFWSSLYIFSSSAKKCIAQTPPIPKNKESKNTLETSNISEKLYLVFGSSKEILSELSAHCHVWQCDLKMEKKNVFIISF